LSNTITASSLYLVRENSTLKRGVKCSDDVKVVSVHAALGLSVHASVLCTYEQQSNSLSGDIRMPADWWSRARSTL